MKQRRVDPQLNDDEAPGHLRSCGTVVEQAAHDQDVAGNYPSTCWAMFNFYSSSVMHPRKLPCRRATLTIFLEMDTELW